MYLLNIRSVSSVHLCFTQIVAHYFHFAVQIQSSTEAHDGGSTECTATHCEFSSYSHPYCIYRVHHFYYHCQFVADLMLTRVIT